VLNIKAIPLLATIILTLLDQPVWADDRPATFDCELKLVCELSFHRMDKQKECDNKTSVIKKELIYLGKQPFGLVKKNSILITAFFIEPAHIPLPAPVKKGSC
jgi:hypothetical protein